MTIDQVIAIIGQAATWVVGRITIDRAIAIIGQLATWFTVLIVFWTLREMARQRKQALQPELVIPRVRLYGAISSDYSPIDWGTESSNQEGSKESIPKRRSSNVTIYNLGVGSATNISLRWDFDYAAAVKFTNQLCQKLSIPFLFELNIKGGKYLRLMSTKSRFESFISLDGDLHHDYDYLLPVSVTSKGIDTFLPSSYTELASLILYSFVINAHETGGITTLNLLEMPSLELQLKYKDISGIRYIKNLEAIFSSWGLQIDSKTQFVSFSVLLEFR